MKSCAVPESHPVSGMGSAVSSATQTRTPGFFPSKKRIYSSSTPSSTMRTAAAPVGRAVASLQKHRQVVLCRRTVATTSPSAQGKPLPLDEPVTHLYQLVIFSASQFHQKKCWAVSLIVRDRSFLTSSLLPVVVDRLSDVAPSRFPRPQKLGKPGGLQVRACEETFTLSGKAFGFFLRRCPRLPGPH